MSELLQHLEYKAGHIFGDMEQEARKLTLNRFRSNKIRLLVVTDVAARGIDIPLLENVINYDFPGNPKLFIHRCGRTARAGATGTAWSLLVNSETGYLHDLRNFIGRKLLSERSLET